MSNPQTRPKKRSLNPRRGRRRASGSSIREAALAYAAQSWPVLACYTNTPTGCSCDDSRCLSPGKHPLAKISPHGVQSATTDLDEIARWPKTANIGIALGHKNLLALDVDDAEIAAALLAPETVLQDETGAVRTGRGVHVYFLCSGDKRTRHLRDKVTGHKIGSIQGLGSYVIAPPSAAPVGRLYKWIGQKAGDWIPHLIETTDALKYVRRLLAPHGVEPVETRNVDVENLPDTPIEEYDLHDISQRVARADDLLNIRRRLRGERLEGVRDTEKDLSGWEHFAACQILRTAKQYNIASVDSLILAGIIKKLDRVYYGKFESDVERGRRSRSAADKRYHIAAIRALDAENMRPEPPPDGAEPPDELDLVSKTGADKAADVVDDQPSYLWDEEVGRLYHVTYHKKATTQTRVANFMVKLLSEIVVDKGSATPDRVWRVQITSATGHVREVSLRADEFDSTGSLERALSHKLSHDYIVSHNGHVHLKPAILELTNPHEVQRYSIRATPGWWTITNDLGEEERVYLLPSALGAITRRGLKTDLRMRMDELAEIEDEIARKEFEPYGRGVRLPASKGEKRQAWGALRALIECGPLGITVPIVLQVLMGPVWSAGADEVPSLLHITGRTGVLKTSFCLAAMSLFGTFRKTTPPTASWTSVSPSALRSLLSAAKDMTVLVDDYKEGAVYDKRGMRELVQAYADKSMRQRLKSSGERRKSLELQAVMLSNGEDRWEREASMVARTIFLDIHDRDIDDQKLRVAQDAVDAGTMQLLGGHYLSWLARQDSLFEKREVEEKRERWHRKLLETSERYDMHRRLLASVSTVAAVGDVFLAFVEECYPKQYAEARRWMRAGIRGLVSGTRERGEEVKRLAPLRQMLDYIASEAEAGKVSLMPLRGITGTRTRLPDSPRAEIIGWWSRGKYERQDTKTRRIMHLNESTTFSWYHREMRRQGREVTFSWSAVLQEAKNGYGAYEHRLRVGRHKRQIRLVSMPLKLLNISEVH